MMLLRSDFPISPSGRLAFNPATAIIAIEPDAGRSTVKRP